NRSEISRGDSPKLGQQFFAQGRRLLGLKGGRPLAMHSIATLSIAGLSRRHSRLAVPRHKRGFVSWRRLRARTITKIGRIQIVLARNSNEREQGIAAGGGARASAPPGGSGARSARATG